VVQARVLHVKPTHIELDREWQGSNQISFDYIVLATGTRLSKPAAMDDDDKLSSVGYLQKHQAGVKRSESILIVGGGAVGVQMATDLKEYYPEKEVTVVQSRARVMPNFHSALHDLIQRRFDELGVWLITGSRVTIQSDGFPSDGSSFDVQLTNGNTESTQFVILATGQTPNNQLLADLDKPHPEGESIVNPDNGFIRIRPTMQFLDEKYPNLFAVGDIADTGAQKAARPGSAQAAVVAKNIQALIEGRAAEDTYVKGPGAIHLILGMVGLAWRMQKSPDFAVANCISRRTMSFSETPIQQRGRPSPGSMRRMGEYLPFCVEKPSWCLQFHQWPGGYECGSNVGEVGYFGWESSSISLINTAFLPTDKET
jgi:NADH dehydrogenase FAD-containing subunit